MAYTYQSIEATAKQLNYSVRYFREVVMKEKLVEGIHYIRPFNGRKILIILEKVEEEMMKPILKSSTQGIPMAAGGYCNG